MTTGTGVLYHQFDLAVLAGAGSLSYNNAVDSADYELGQSNCSYTIGSLSKYATEVSTGHPATLNPIQGWKWDQRVFATDDTENIMAWVPMNWGAVTSGITATYFKSGIGSNFDLELKEIDLVTSSGVNQEGIFEVWAPLVNHGYYYDYQDVGYLYSDDSEIVYPSFSGVVGGIVGSGVTWDGAIASGFNTVTLSSMPKIGVPITAEQFIWDNEDGKYEINTKWRKRVEFTGLLDSDLEREDTINDTTGEIHWLLIDRNENEFIVSYSGVSNDSGYPEIVFNNQVVDQIGGSWTGISFSGLEILGLSDGSASQSFHTEYSPIDSSMPTNIFSFATIPSGILDESIVASGVAGSGLVQGGLLPSGLIINGALDIDVYEWVAQDQGTVFSGYQANVDWDLGIVEFGDNVTYSGTVEVPAAGHYIGISYWRTARVEYEPENTEDTILGIEANINPIYRKSGQGFVYLSTVLEDPVSILLEAELAEITTNTFGPLAIGNNYAAVVATVKDSKENVLEDQQVTIEVTSTPAVGTFGTAGTSTTVITDKDGEAKAYYNPPRTINDIGEEVTYANFSQDNSPAYVGKTQTTTLQVNNILIEGDVDDIFTFQNLIDDPFLGYLEASISQTDTTAQLKEFYRNYFIEHDIWGPTGLADVNTVNEYLSGQTWEDLHRTLLDLARPEIFTVNSNMGRKVLVAKPDVFSLNPHTFTANAWSPMQPFEIAEVSAGVYNLIYDTSQYEMPVPSGSMTPTSSGDLYSYFVVAPTMVTMKASVYNERLQQNVYSNEIQIKLTIPDYMSGLWIIDELNDIHEDEISSLLSSVIASGQKVPLGFRLKSSNIALAGALDGITFLDRNPTYNSDIWSVTASGNEVEVNVTPARHQFNINTIS